MGGGVGKRAAVGQRGMQAWKSGEEEAREAWDENERQASSDCDMNKEGPKIQIWGCHTVPANGRALLRTLVIAGSNQRAKAVCWNLDPRMFDSEFVVARAWTRDI
eukprot:749489-Hanusia_phi.AAC.3